MRFLCLALVFAILVSPAARADQETFEHGPFGTVTLYHTAPKPAHVVLFVSGDGGWNLGVVEMAKALATKDALVVGIDYPHYRRALEASAEACVYPPGDFELLSRTVQMKIGYAEYVTPVLVGYSSGASLVYTLLAQAPPSTFRGGISLGFCPDLPLKKPLCRENALRAFPAKDGKSQTLMPTRDLARPWIALQGTIDQVCNPDTTAAFVRSVRSARAVMLPKVGHGFSVQANWMPQFSEAFASVLSSPDPAATPPATAVTDLGDLPLTEVPAAGKASSLMAVIVTGDGGWSVTEKALSSQLSQAGIPVVGLNSLHYFWKRRTPDTAGADLERILDHYSRAWKKPDVVLVGYSMGGSVLPFMANRLSPAWKSKIAQIILLGPETRVDFQFHLTDWFGKHTRPTSLPVLPEIEKLKGIEMVCIYGVDEKDCLCPQIPATLARSVERPGGHRVGTGVDPIMKEILDADARRSGTGNK